MPGCDDSGSGSVPCAPANDQDVSIPFALTARDEGGVEAIGQLVAAEAGLPVSSSLAAAIAGHTGGNPFFAKEMIRHLLEERALGQDGSGALEASLPLVAVPEGVRQVIARRCARLSDNAERVAVSASGFAGPFLFPVAAVAASLGDQAALAALDELLAAGLIRPAGAAERYEFVHALARQAIYDTLSPSRQARLLLWQLNAEADRPDRAVILQADPEIIARRLRERGAHNRFQQSPGSSHAEVHFYRQATDRLIQAGFDVLQVEVNQRTPEQAAMFIRNRLMSFFTVSKD